MSPANSLKLCVSRASILSEKLISYAFCFLSAWRRSLKISETDFSWLGTFSSVKFPHVGASTSKSYGFRSLSSCFAGGWTGAPAFVGCYTESVLYRVTFAVSTGTICILNSGMLVVLPRADCGTQLSVVNSRPNSLWLVGARASFLPYLLLAALEDPAAFSKLSDSWKVSESIVADEGVTTELLLRAGAGASCSGTLSICLK